MKKSIFNFKLLPSKNIQALASHISMSQKYYVLEYEFSNNGSLKNLIINCNFDYPRDIK